MKVFEHPNLDKFICPICNTSEDKPVVLIGVDGTQEGNNMQAAQIHLYCIDLTLFQNNGKKLLGMVF